MLSEQIKDFFTSVQERQELASASCCRVTDRTVQHSLFQFTATQIKRENVLESVILSVPRRTFPPNKSSDKETSSSDCFYLGRHTLKKL